MSADRIEPASIVFEHLRRVGDRKLGYGWKARVNRGLKRATGYINRDMSKRTMRLTTLFDVLEVLGEEPGSFFAEAFGTDDLMREEPDLSLPAAHDPKLAEILPLLTLDTDTDAEGFRSPVMVGILERKKTDPVTALEMACSALLLVANGALPKNLTFPLLLESGSLMVRLDRLPNARACFSFVDQVARREELPATRAELLLRLPALLHRETARPLLALRVADKAYLAFTDLGDRAGVGQSLVIRSWYLFFLGRVRDSIQSLKASLDFLPPDDYYVSIAHQALGVILGKTGDLDSAVEHLELAELASEGDPLLKGMILWAKADIALGKLDYERAAMFLLAAQDLLLPISPVDATRVSLELARCHLMMGDQDRALETISGLTTLLESLEPYPVVHLNVVELLRISVSSSSRLTTDVLEAATEAIRDSGVVSRMDDRPTKARLEWDQTV